jgi:hypothetical protein
MKAYDFITRLDQARYGRSVSEDTKPVAPAPSHAPTSGKDYTTTGKGSSEDQGERMGGEKDAIKQSKHEIPAPVAAAPSHAPTSGKDYTTTGKGSSEDQGEKISKEAIKETVAALIDGEGEFDLEALLGEGGHKPGCKCNFCMNLPRNKGKKADSDEDEKKDGMQEAYGAPSMRRPAAPTAPPMRRRMGFRSQVPRPKAAINPYQPAMEHASSFNESVSRMADKLLDFPGND